MAGTSGAPPLIDRLVASPVNYWGGFLCHIGTGLGALALGLAATDSPLWAVVPAAGAGWLTWTFLEYLVHRWVFHGPLAVALRGHALHHRRPRATVGVPFFLPSVLGWAIFLGLSWPLGRTVAGAWVAALMISYAAYGLIHHAQHARRFRSTLGWALQRHHLVHHKRPDTNFGVTTRLWDRLLGTAAP